jgi:hypothetical protein
MSDAQNAIAGSAGDGSLILECDLRDHGPRLAINQQDFIRGFDVVESRDNVDAVHTRGQGMHATERLRRR